MDWGDFCRHLNQYMPALSRRVRSHLSPAAIRRAEEKALSWGRALQSVAFHHVLRHLSTPFWIQSFAPLSTELNIFHFWSFVQLFMTICNFNPARFSGDLHLPAWDHFGGAKGVTLMAFLPIYSSAGPRWGAVTHVTQPYDGLLLPTSYTTDVLRGE